MVARLSLLVGCVAGCAMAPPELPLTTGSGSLTARVSTRDLTATSAALTVDLVATEHLSGIAVTVSSDDAAALSVTPAVCRKTTLDPPHTSQGRHPPFALPAVPFCTFVATAPRAGRYRITIQFDDGSGKPLLPAMHATILIGGTTHERDPS